LGLIVAALSSTHTSSIDDNNGGYNVVSVIVSLTMGLLLVCLSLVCEIPVAVAQYKSSKIMNHYQLRILV